MNPLDVLSAAGWPILIPFLAAIVLALVPSWRVGAWINAGAATVCFLAACQLPWLVGQPAKFLFVDRLAAHFSVLSAFVAMTTGWFSLTYVRADIVAQRITRQRLRLYHVLFQTFVGATMAALLLDNVGVTWMAVETATLAAVLVTGLPRTAAALAAAWKFFMVCGVGLALALFGSFVLYLAASRALGPGLASMSWSVLLPAAARCDGAVLNLAFVFFLVGYGTRAGLAPLHGWLPDALAEGPTPVAAVLAGTMLNAVLFVLLRLRSLMAANAAAGGGAIAPGPAFMTLGLLSLLLAAFSLWRRRDLKRFFAFSTIAQSGVAAFAFGLGGPAASFAGLLHMTLHTLTNAGIFQCVGRAAQLKGSQGFAEISGLLASHRRLGLTLAASIISLAALPPFGLFASEFLIVTATLRRAPLLALPFGIGIVTVAWALIWRLQTISLGTPTPDRGPAPSALMLAPVWLHLGVILLLGLAMPASVAAWMAAIARSLG